MRHQLAALSLLVLVACAKAPRNGPRVGSAPLPPGTFILAHTNDLHAHYAPNRADWLPGEPDIGGMAAVSAHVRHLRAERGASAVLYLDGGDVQSGTPLMELETEGAAGGAMVDLMAMSGCNAWVLGNHEFDRGFDNTQALIKASEATVLSANLDLPEGDAPALEGLEDHVIFEANGVTVGVFGLTTTRLDRLASPETMTRLDVKPLAETAAAQVALLDPQTDLIVALTHIGIESDRRLAAEVPGIDVIVGGHSHTSMKAPEQVGDTWIVQAGSYARQLGVAEVSVREDEVNSLRWELRDLTDEARPGPPQPSVVKQVAAIEREIKKRFDQQVGESTAALLRDRNSESGLGRFAADVVRTATGADVGLYNHGGLRADLQAGPLTVRDLYQVFPFGNEVVSFELRGDELAGLMLRTTYGVWGARTPALLWSGVHWTWQERLGAPELVEVTVGGEPLDLGRTYRVATNSYIAEQWSYHLGLEPRGLRGHEQTVLQAAVGVSEAGPIAPPTNPRCERAGDE